LFSDRIPAAFGFLRFKLIEARQDFVPINDVGVQKILSVSALFFFSFPCELPKQYGLNRGKASP
jgi:hypothetical protein